MSKWCNVCMRNIMTPGTTWEPCTSDCPVFGKTFGELAEIVLSANMKTEMEYYLVDVKSVEFVNRKEVAFDYINTYYNYEEAYEKAIALTKDKKVVSVSLHKWVLLDNGGQEHREVLFTSRDIKS